MHRRTAQRRIAALALVAALALAGARPAAATDVGFRGHLGSLWSTVTKAPAALWATVIGWFGKAEKSDPKEPPPGPTTDAGWILDPNGGS